MVRPGGAVGTVGGYGVQSVGNGEDPGTERDFLALESARVAGSVPALLVGVDDLSGVLQEGDFAHYLISQLAVLAHLLDLFRVERARFPQYRIADGHLADVVQEGAVRDGLDFFIRQPHGSGDGDGE